MGRLTRDPEIRYSQQGDNQMAIARYTLAVDRRFNRNSDQNADFISCVAFGRSAEFAEKYLKQGTKIVATGRIQTGNDGGYQPMGRPEPASAGPVNDGFMSIPEGIEDDLPFK